MNGSALQVTHAPAAGQASVARTRPSGLALWLLHVDCLLWIATAAFAGSLVLIVAGS